MKKNKILFTIDVMGNGGAERVISVLANEFVKHGYDVQITQLYGNKCDYALNKNIILNSVSPSSSRFRKLNTLIKLRNHIKSQNPDVIISFLANINVYTIIAAVGLKKSIIASERNDPSKEPSKIYLHLLRNICYYFVKGIVFQTKQAQDYFNNKIKNKSVIIYNPILEDLPESSMINRNRKISTVCRLSKQKNIKLLIDAFEIFINKHEGYKLYIYGEGELRYELERYIQNKNLQNDIFLPGFFNDVHEKIKNSCMFILSSDYEGMPNALIEAMAIGIPCISTDCPVGGPRELITNYENGILTEVNNVSKLVNAMEYIVMDSDRANKMGNQGALIKNSLSNDKIFRQWEQMIWNVMK